MYGPSAAFAPLGAICSSLIFHVRLYSWKVLTHMYLRALHVDSFEFLALLETPIIPDVVRRGAAQVATKC